MYLHLGGSLRFLSTSRSVPAALLFLLDLVVLRLVFQNWLGLGWQRLQELPWLWFLVTSHVGDLELLLGKRDAETSADPLAALFLGVVLSKSLTTLITFFLSGGLLLSNRYLPADELVLLVQERHSSLDDLTGLESFGEVSLESIEGNGPVLADLVEAVVDDLPDAGAHADLDQASLLLGVLLGHELRLEHDLLLFLLGFLSALVFGARGRGLLGRGSCVGLVWSGLNKLLALRLPDGGLG